MGGSVLVDCSQNLPLSTPVTDQSPAVTDKTRLSSASPYQQPADFPISPVHVTLVCVDPPFRAKMQTQPNKPISKVIKKFAKMMGLSPSCLKCKVDDISLMGQELTRGLAGAVINVEKKI